ncbi:hypothetical protein PQX77_010544 [Marasmius sp. AFHP31]|nr:hypothetical protein PQX77_010544 [Marasmius sp. AFHP31]
MKDDPYLKLLHKALEGMILVMDHGSFWVDYLPILRYIPTWVPGASFKRKAHEWFANNKEVKEKPWDWVIQGEAAGIADSSFCTRTAERLGVIMGEGSETEDMIKNCAFSAYAAGVETSVSVLTTFILAMTLHPEVQARAQKEIDSVLGPGGLPDFNDRDSLPYINAIVAEVLRWRPSLPLSVPHRAVNDDVYAGYHIPAGATVVGNVWAIMHDENLYGSDVQSFNPDRFMRTDGKNPPFPNQIFGFGRRICPGQDFAMNSLYLTISNILASYTIAKPLDENGNEYDPKVDYSDGAVSLKHDTSGMENSNAGPGHQNNNYAGTQTINYGDGQIGQVLGGEVRFVKHFHVQASNPHKTLWEAVACIGASHNAERQYERGECLEGTREEVLRIIHEWLANRSLPICWLSGAAGVGKSAIAMTVAKACEGEGLVASFFCFRSDPKRNNPSALMLTISHGLVVNMPFAKSFINQRGSDDPTILEAKLEDQFRELVLKPSLQRRRWRRLLAKLSPPVKESNLVIIDGLDECGDEQTQQRVLSTILSSYQQSPRSPLRYLICSRPEAWIQEVFKAEDVIRITECVMLNDSFMPDRDIKRYYLHEFQLIRTSAQYSRVSFPKPWPSSEDLGYLVQKSSGQFVYAATTVRSVKLAYSDPVAQLQIILDYTPEDSSSQSSFSRIDGLYHVILSTHPNREKLLSIIASIFILPPHVPSSPEFIEMLLGVRAGEVDLSLRSLHSVLDIRGGDVGITAYHTSFTDFLYDPSRSSEFYIDRTARHNALALQWLRTLSRYVKAHSSIVLDPDSYQSLPNVRCLLKTWTTFCFDTDNQPTEELISQRDNLFRNILSTFPDQRRLVATLVLVILLPVPADMPSDWGEFRALTSFILGPDRVHASSTMEVLEACGLVTLSGRAELHPSFLAFLSDPSQEYYIDLQEYRDSISRRWIEVLEPCNLPSSR